MQTNADSADELLGILLDAVEAAPGGVGTGITLTVGGLVITGNLVSEQTWLETHPADFVPEEGIAKAKARAELRRQLMSGRDPEEFTAEERDELSADLQLVHLKDVIIFAGSSPIAVPSDVFYWRGKVSEVTGWTLGRLSIM